MQNGVPYNEWPEIGGNDYLHAPEEEVVTMLLRGHEQVSAVAIR